MGAIVPIVVINIIVLHMVKKNCEKRFFTLLGSNWNNSANASSFYWNLNNTASNRNRNISSRLEHAIKINE